MSNLGPGKGENSLFLNLLHVSFHTFQVIICFPLGWSHTPWKAGLGGCQRHQGGTKLSASSERHSWYLETQEQLKKPEVIKSMLVSLNNSRWTDWPTPSHIYYLRVKRVTRFSHRKPSFLYPSLKFFWVEIVASPKM